MTGMDVSLIIPTYNRLALLKRAIASCDAQQCRLEVIVVDDGSTDGTWDWLQTQPQIRSFYQTNQGQAWAVLNAFQASRGEYIRFLDSDDILAPHAIDEQRLIARESSADLVYGAVDRIVLKTGEILEGGDPGIWDDFLAVQLGEANGSHYLGMLFRRSLFNQVPVRRPEFSYRDDRMLLLEVGLLDPKVVRSPGVAGYWSKHARQMHDNYRGSQLVVANLQMLDNFRRILKIIIDRNELSERRAKAASNVLWPLAHQLAITHLDEGAAVADWVIKLDPTFQPPNHGVLGWCYRHLGFVRTEKLLSFRRMCTKLLRSYAPKPSLQLPTPPVDPPGLSN